MVKVGTAVVARADGRLALGRLGALVEQIHSLQQSGLEVILISSGSVGLGAERLGFERKPTSVVDRQACAAAGQSALMGFYDGLFFRLGTPCAQVLLTEEDFHTRRRYVNLAATLQRLLSLGVVPIINENDTVSTAELALTGGAVFGDNDRLSALVASGLGADALVLLSDVDSVYTGPPSEPGAQRISLFDGEVDVRFGSTSKGGRGGMAAKVAAAQVGAASGVHVVIADGFGAGVLGAVLAGEDRGTLFPARGSQNHRRRWLAFATLPAGRLVVNAGAYEALTARKASLLAPGVLAVTGSFGPGSVVSLCDAEGTEFGRGVCDRSAADLRQLLSVDPVPRGKAVVHRDNVVILTEESS